MRTIQTENLNTVPQHAAYANLIERLQQLDVLEYVKGERDQIVRGLLEYQEWAEKLRSGNLDYSERMSEILGGEGAPRPVLTGNPELERTSLALVQALRDVALAGVRASQDSEPQLPPGPESSKDYVARLGRERTRARGGG